MLAPPPAARKLTSYSVKAMRERHAYGVPAWWLAVEYGVHVRTVEKVLRRESWRWTW